jgi:hypothetical protein
VKDKHLIAIFFHNFSGVLDGAGIVPNMVAAIRVFIHLFSISPLTMPRIAPAALEKIVRLMRFSPATSTIEGIMVMSLVPTYALVSPEAIVVTINFGTPTGKARMALVAITVPPPPPMEMIPSNLPAS